MEKTVITTYLEMTHRDQFKPKPGFENMVEVKEIGNDPFINFMLFAGVGLPHRWSSRFKFSIKEWQEYFASTNLKTFLGLVDGIIIGYFELIIDRDDVEIKFFGIFPQFTGKGMGSYFLSHAIQSAWEAGAKRIWVHTCTSDHEAALPNYLARGFKIYDEKSAIENVPDTSELIEKISVFFKDYLNKYSSLGQRK